MKDIPPCFKTLILTDSIQKGRFNKVLNYAIGYINQVDFITNRLVGMITIQPPHSQLK